MFRNMGKRRNYKTINLVCIVKIAWYWSDKWSALVCGKHVEKAFRSIYNSGWGISRKTCEKCGEPRLHTKANPINLFKFNFLIDFLSAPSLWHVCWALIPHSIWTYWALDQSANKACRYSLISLESWTEALRFTLNDFSLYQKKKWKTLASTISSGKGNAK